MSSGGDETRRPCETTPPEETEVREVKNLREPSKTRRLAVAVVPAEEDPYADVPCTD